MLLILHEKIVYLVGAGILTKNADINKYGYSGYGIGFDRRVYWVLFSGGGYDQNILIFGVDMSFSAHTDNKKRYINIRNRSNTRSRTYTNCRKKILD